MRATTVLFILFSTAGLSASPSFEVEIVKPRLSRPLFGVLPNVAEVVLAGGNPWFSDETPGATIGRVGLKRIELRAEEWDLRVYANRNGRVARATRVVFPIRLGDRSLTLRCRPADPAVGYLMTIPEAGSKKLSGRFRVELAECEDAISGKAIEWPPAPLVMSGTFERLPVRSR